MQTCGSHKGRGQKRRFQDIDISYTEEARTGVNRDNQKSQQKSAKRLLPEALKAGVWISKVLSSPGHSVIL